jgi:5-oxoprolinase (ATP-hydrolysing) subunit A
MSRSGVTDLNADVGERPDAVSDDLEIMRSLTSANVACGFHAGNAETMRLVCEAAAALDVVVGAHLSYLDRTGFGRRDTNTPPTLLAAHVTEQLSSLGAVATAAGAPVRYVKPHGALYNRVVHDATHAIAVAAAVANSDRKLKMLCPPHSALATAAKEYGLEAVAEGFADRAYLADGSLTPRSEPNSVLDHDAALRQGLAIATSALVTAGDGTHLNLTARSLCLHSDTPGAAVLAADLRRALIGAGIRVEPFA